MNNNATNFRNGPQNQNDCPSGTILRCSCDPIEFQFNESVVATPIAQDNRRPTSPRQTYQNQRSLTEGNRRPTSPRQTYQSQQSTTQNYQSNRQTTSPRQNDNRPISPRRARSPRRTYGRNSSQEPRSEEECPEGTYYRSGYTRNFLGGQQYIKATCVKIPQGVLQAKFNYSRSPRY